MEQYIPKSVLLAEIEKGKRMCDNHHSDYWNGCYNTFIDILSFIDTLEVKEIQEFPVSYKQSPVVLYGLTGSVGNTKEEPQVKESAEIERDKETCKENGDSLTREPVNEVWHNMSEEAENGRNIIIIDPKNFYGAVLRKGGSQLRNHNKERYAKWAYIDDIIK